VEARDRKKGERRLLKSQELGPTVGPQKRGKKGREGEKGSVSLRVLGLERRKKGRLYLYFGK